MKINNFLLILSFVFCFLQVKAQDTVAVKKQEVPNSIKPLKVSLNNDGSNFIQFTGLVQIWARHTELNPGSLINKASATSNTDVGIRRLRFQIIGQLNDRIFFYSQIGINNFNYNSQRKFGFFVHDAVGEYAFVPKKFSLGMGLSSWTGPLRYSSPAVASFLGYDAPLFMQTTNDLSDQFLRKLGVYAKGKLGKLDYRINFVKPMLINSSNMVNIPGGQASIGTLGTMPNNISTFSTLNPSIQYTGYFSYQFKDQEQNRTPYQTGTYLGEKNIFNIGVGYQFQKNAMWHKEVNVYNPLIIDTIKSNLIQFGLDVMYEKVLSNNKSMFSIYLAYLFSDYGKNYIRNLGVMNTADAGQGYNGAGATYNSGGGNAFAMNGTGNSFYVQTGYKFKNQLLKSYGTIMPYCATQLSSFDAFDRMMIMYDIGINWLMMGNNSKFTLNYQNRPYFSQEAPNDVIKETTRKGMVVLQYQLSF
jgi:hypothetical protein